jgi:hypothetical protein
MVVAYQVTEALKILTGDIKALRPQLISFDLWETSHSKLNVGSVKKESCLTCGSQPTYPFLDYDNQLKTAVLCGRDTVQIRPSGKGTFNRESLIEQLKSAGLTVTQNDHLTSFTVEGEIRMVVFNDGRTFVHGIHDVTLAKKLYHQYVG